MNSMEWFLSESLNEFRYPLRPGDVVTLLEGVDMDDDGGLDGDVLFEDSDIGRADFISLVENADGMQVIESGQNS